jgi:vacuolar protein sorting-associated protein 29
VEEYEGGYYLFPGSITGAYSVTDPASRGFNPSFILLAVQGDRIVCYVYELKNGEVDVTKTEISKKDEEIYD